LRQLTSLPRSSSLILLATAGLLVVTAAGRFLFRTYADHAQLRTGDARWIWASAARESPEAAPMHFVASRDFARPATSAGRAQARIFVDRSYVLWINGVRMGEGEQKPGDRLDTYDVSQVLKSGRNRVSIEASSPTGVGGILFWLDPGGGPAVVSDSTWEISGSEGKNHHAIIWGRPPMYPWGYPALPEFGIQNSKFKIDPSSRANLES
jgi:hypothetical protein